MVEKALLLVGIVIAIILAVSSVGSALSVMMQKTECAWGKKTLCIIDDPNQ